MVELSAPPKLMVQFKSVPGIRMKMTTLRNILERLMSALNRRSRNRSLAQLDDHLLRDIGIDPTSERSLRTRGTKLADRGYAGEAHLADPLIVRFPGNRMQLKK